MGKKAIVVFADKDNRTNKWAMKTEYFEHFPETQITLLKNGYNLAYLENASRWCLDSDLERKAEFVKHLHSEYGFEQKCALIGMSCGGNIAVKFAARYPEYASVLYLDAPVMNYLSCPACLGASKIASWDEFERHMKMDRIQLLSYREHPIDVMHKLLEAKKPIILVYGDSDDIVPYEENGKLLEKYYISRGGSIKVIAKPGVGHHPHGLEDVAPIVDFIKSYI